MPEEDSMRELSPTLRGIVVASCLAAGPVALSAPNAAPLERTLRCEVPGANGCEFSCVGTSGTSLFVHDHLQAARVTEFGGPRALVELQNGHSDKLISLLIGDISRCTFKGLLDSTLPPPPLAHPDPAPSPAPAPAPTPAPTVTVTGSSHGGGALSWSALLALLAAGVLRWRAVSAVRRD
jgi:hypothetical protein